MFGLKKDFCLWVVSPSDGKVRKLRFTLRRAVGVFSVVMLLVVGTVYLAGDYTRLHRVLGKNHFSLRKVRSERDALRTMNKSLKASVEEIELHNKRVLTYERQVRQRLEEIASILGAATKLGVLKQEKLKQLELSAKSETTGALGGAELDCIIGDDNCSGSEDLLQLDDARAMLRPSRISESSAGELVPLLDRYIAILKKVPFGHPCALKKVTSGYGWRRSPFSGRVRMHAGIDISLPMRTKVYSTAYGTVKAVKRNRTYGIMVDVDHGDGIVTRYAHLSRALVKVGDTVARGQSIALSGNTGRSTGPHLHYEVRVNDRAKNPKKLLELGSQLSDLA